MQFPRKITTIERVLIRLSVLVFIPKVIWNVLSTRQDKNVLNDGKRNLSGKKLSATSSDIPFAKVKAASKALKVTINDMVTACLGSAVKEYMESKGDTKCNSVNIAIPANVRFEHYPNLEAV